MRWNWFMNKYRRKLTIILSKMKYIYSIYIGLLSLLFVSCQEEQWNNMQTGGFLISLSDEVSTDVTTKSTPAELGEPATDNFKLLIVNETTNNPLYDGAYKSGTIPASAGTYTVTATFGDNPPVALDKPYYKGDETGVIVEEGETTSVQLVCKVANALASVSFPDATEMAKIYDSYWVKVAVENSYVKLIPNSSNSAYFQVGKEVSFYFEGKKLNGQSVSTKLEHDKLPSTFEAADHYILTLSFNDDLSLDISKVEADKVTISETIPMEWLPKPKLETEGFDENQKLIFYETEEPVSKIHINSAIGLEQLQFNVNFGDPIYSSLNGDYDLSTMTLEQKQAFENAGIVIPQLADAKASTFDFTEFAKKLTANQDNSVKSVDNIITLTSVTANGRLLTAEELKAYTISIKKKPVFSVSVDERNVWSKEFTANPVNVMEGDADIANDAEMTYQYSSDNGQTWNDCNDNINRRQKFETHPYERTLKVRAKFRNFTSEVVDINLEESVQLPNSGMEEWSEEIYKDSYYCFYPWNLESNCHWNTNNLFTTRHRYNSGVNAANYNGFHAVSYVPGRNGGKAAELRSTANGRGNTIKFLIFSQRKEQDYNMVAGELFTGSVNLTMGTSGVLGDADGSKDKLDIIKDAKFENRPTALKFWYKYVPYNSDMWRAHIELLDEAKNVIIQQDFTSSEAKNAWTEASVCLDYNEGAVYEKCKYIYVIFCSTVNAGANMPYREITQTFYVEEQEKTFSPAYVGSVLTIADIYLVYDK